MQSINQKKAKAYPKRVRSKNCMFYYETGQKMRFLSKMWAQNPTKANYLFSELQKSNGPTTICASQMLPFLGKRRESAKISKNLRLAQSAIFLSEPLRPVAPIPVANLSPIRRCSAWIAVRSRPVGLSASPQLAADASAPRLPATASA